MAQLSVSIRQPLPKKGSAPYGEISGIILMGTDQIEGELVVSFSESAVLGITSRMIMEEVDTLDQLAIDTVGEITNMVAGGAKALLEKSGYDFDMHTPSIHFKKDYPDLELPAKLQIIVPYTSEAGNFFVELGFKNR